MEIFELNMEILGQNLNLTSEGITLKSESFSFDIRLGLNLLSNITLHPKTYGKIKTY